MSYLIIHKTFGAKAVSVKPWNANINHVIKSYHHTRLQMETIAIILYISFVLPLIDFQTSSVVSYVIHVCNFVDYNFGPLTAR